MNFLLRPTQSVGAEPLSVHETPSVTSNIPKLASNLDSLIADDPYAQYLTIEDCNGETDGTGDENGNAAGLDARNYSIIAKHSDVFEEEGWITIPYKELPDNWNDAPDINSLRSLDRPFVFPGEQVHILVCLSACKQDTEIITPFKVAAVMSKNGKGQSPNKENGNAENVYSSASSTGEMSPSQETDQNSEKRSDVSAGESLLRMEDHKRQTVMLLQRFENSHFFVRIAESGEPLWSRKTATRKSSESSDSDGTNSTTNDARKIAKVASCLNAVVDKGNFDPRLSGGAARNIVKCCSLRNGDIVVLLEVNVGDDYLNDPVIEILQFEKYHERTLFSENHDSISYGNQDPCGELLKWLLPLDNSLPPPSRPLSPPVVSTSGFGSPSQKSGFSSSSGSHLFSFGNFRSYSMSALPQNTVPPPAPIKAASSKPSFDLEDWDQYSSQKLWRSQRTGSEGILSFRGVSLERERFSVRCGLEGIYIPGRRWKRKVEIIQPIEINSFATDCNTDDLLCVQIKNVSPTHAPDIVVYVDAITVVFEEALKGGEPSPLPIACTEAGEDHSLPNLALRRGEEHSFILKPVTSMWKSIKANAERSTMRSQKQAGNATSNLRILSKTIETKKNPTVDQYAINVSCRCNYTESILFFKRPTSWRPRISRDLLISVASEMSGQHRHNGVPELPVQELTLQVSNLTSEEQTLTVLAPASFTSPPSVVSLNSAPTSPLSPFVGFPEFTGRIAGDRYGSAMRRLSSAPLASQKQNFDGGAPSVSLNEYASQESDVIPSSGFGCTHLWLQSRVPLGCVPSHSTATVKLELLPLTDGIITLDTLQIDVKEKGLTYIPEHSLKINATSGISTGVH